MPQIGVITEQGDLGLGFDVLNQQDQRVYKESTQKEDKENNTKEKNEQK